MLKLAGLYHPLRDWRRDRYFAAKMQLALDDWKTRGCPSPPPDSIKHSIIREYAYRYRTSVLVETGTFYGDTVFALRREFREIHTIELSLDLYKTAQRQFAHLRHIHCHFGDSADLLAQIAADLTAPAIYWLDGHFCHGPSARADKDTPITEELACLLERPQRQDVILIDDARLFTGHDGYSAIEELRTYVKQRRPNSLFEVRSDVIRIAPI